MWKTIRLGAITYSSGAGNGEVQASNWDMRGIWINNKMRFPLDIFHNGILKAQVSAYNGIEYMGGGASTIYFDNNREGVNYGDVFEFRYSLPGREEKIFSTTIDDEQCMHMYVGVISPGMWGPDPDNAIYRIDEDDHIGITYYVPIGGYRTMGV